MLYSPNNEQETRGHNERSEKEQNNDSGQPGETTPLTTEQRQQRLQERTLEHLRRMNNDPEYRAACEKKVI